MTTADYCTRREFANALDAAAVPTSQQNRLIAALAPMRRDVVQP